MPQIIVEREEGSLADRFRPYKVIIDGQVRGTIRHNETCAFSVQGGTHSVSFQVGDYYAPPMKVAVVNKTRLICWSTMAHALGLMAWVNPATWISMLEEDACLPGETAPVIEMPGGEDSDESFELRRSKLWSGGHARLRVQPAAQRNPMF